MIASRLVASLVALLLLAVACGGDAEPANGRVVSLTTTACGHASKTTGAGVIAEDGWVIAAGHVVSGAGSVTVSGPFGQQTGEVVVLDKAADLALIAVPGVSAAPIELAGSSSGASVELAGGGPSGSLQASVIRPVEVRVEAVRSTERISRVGYELDVRVELGDSGGGVFDSQDRLVGVVFGRPLNDEPRSFIVGQDAVAQLLATDRTGSWSCDPEQHRVVSVAG